MRSGLLFASCLGLLVMGCASEVDDSSSVPTAIPGISTKNDELGTPTTLQINAKRAQGPTSTPAPWATPLPLSPTPQPSQAHPISHNLIGKADCLSCHKGPTYFRMPADHATRTNQTCLGCHSPASGPPSSSPHPKAGHEACLVCHLLGTHGAHPVPGDHAGRMNDTCANCHQIK